MERKVETAEHALGPGGHSEAVAWGVGEGGGEKERAKQHVLFPRSHLNTKSKTSPPVPLSCYILTCFLFIYLYCKHLLQSTYICQARF